MLSAAAPDANLVLHRYVVALEDRVERMEALLKRVSFALLLCFLLPRRCEVHRLAAGGSIDWSPELNHDTEGLSFLLLVRFLSRIHSVDGDHLVFSCYTRVGRLRNRVQ